ncbi:MAG: porin [Alphaproteobacteria bacterium]|nr:porin [Alphaproteobacteria bacterium]
MNKYLLGTTALVAASLIAGAASAAEPLKLGVSGHMKQWFGVVNQSTSGSDVVASGAVGQGKDYANTGLSSDTEVYFKGKTTLDNGLEVEARIDVEIVDRGNGANNAAPNNVQVDEEWASIGSAKYGKVYAGVKESINASMHNEPTDVGIGYSEIDQWLHEPTGMSTFGNTAAGAIAGTNTGGNNNWDATSFQNLIDDSASVSYITPKFYGFQFGASYAPNGMGNTGGAGTIGPANRAYHQYDAWDATLAYSGKFGGLEVGADAGIGGAEGSNAYQSGVTASVGVWNAGLKMTYAGFTLGGSYFALNDNLDRLSNTRSATPSQSLDGNAWNAGLSYAAGPWATSFLYYHEQHKGIVNSANAATYRTNENHEEFNAYLLSGKYTLGPGIDAKATGFFGQYKGRNYAVANTENDAKGFGLVTGLDLTF